MSQAPTPTYGTTTVMVEEVHPAPYAQRIVTQHHTLAADQPEDHDGFNTGPAPYDLLCAALGTCTNQTLRMYATRKGWPLTHISTTVHYTKTTTPQGEKHDTFTRTITLQAPTLTEDQRLRLLEIAAKCPVGLTLQGSTGINDSLA